MKVDYKNRHLHVHMYMCCPFLYSNGESNPNLWSFRIILRWYFITSPINDNNYIDCNFHLCISILISIIHCLVDVNNLCRIERSPFMFLSLFIGIKFGDLSHFMSISSTTPSISIEIDTYIHVYIHVHVPVSCFIKENNILWHSAENEN